MLTITGIDDLKERAITETFEREGSEKPVCVADWVARFYLPT